jgi:hypothetical protein
MVPITAITEKLHALPIPMPVVRTTSESEIGGRLSMQPAWSAPDWSRCAIASPPAAISWHGLGTTPAAGPIVWSFRIS